MPRVRETQDPIVKLREIQAVCHPGARLARRVNADSDASKE